MKKKHDYESYEASMKAAAPHRAKACIFMETDASDETVREETRYASALCDDPSSAMAGVIVGGNLLTGAFGGYIRSCLEEHGAHIKGVRQVLHPLEKETCLGKAFVKNVTLLGELGLLFEVCIQPDQLEDVAELATICPATTFVVNHIGCIQGIRRSEEKREDWKRGVEAIAKMPNIVMKISGMLGGWDGGMPDFEFEMQKPYLDHALDCFSADKVVYGSDYPVCNGTANAGEYFRQLAAHVTATRGESFVAKLFEGNARRVYAIR